MRWRSGIGRFVAEGRRALALRCARWRSSSTGSVPKESRVINLFVEFDDQVLRDALSACRELHAIAEHGYMDELRARHHLLKRYFMRFVALPIQGRAHSCRAPRVQVLVQAGGELARGRVELALQACDRRAWAFGGNL